MAAGRRQGARGGSTKEAAESGAFQVAGRRAGGGVPETVAHGGQVTDRAVQLARFVGEHAAVDRALATGPEEETDLVEREAGRASQGDQGQALQNGGLVLA